MIIDVLYSVPRCVNDVERRQTTMTSADPHSLNNDASPAIMRVFGGGLKGSKYRAVLDAC